MRYALILTSFLMAGLLSSANVKASTLTKVEDLRAQSKALLQDAQTQKSLQAKSEKLKLFLQKIAEAREAYKKILTEEPNKDATQVSFLYFTMEPLQAFAENNSKAAQSCADTKDQIERADQQGRGEDAPLTPDAQIASQWLKIFCK